MATTDDLTRLREIAEVLLPGDGASPPAASLPDLDDLIAVALAALGSEAETVRRGLEQLDDRPSWDNLRSFSTACPEEFEVISATVAGAYFMSTAVLDSLGYPHGPRKAPRNDLAADELGSGLLDPMLERESMVRPVA